MGATYIVKACRLTHAIPPIAFSSDRLRKYSRDRRADRPFRRWMGATPLFLALVRARGRRCFHNSAPPPMGGRSRPKASLREGGRTDEEARFDDSGWGRRGG